VFIPGCDSVAVSRVEQTVRAAGTLCWRRAARGNLQVLVVHSARWDEWSWPKGKLDAGESPARCAVRETREESGLDVVLGPPLPTSRYVLPDGRSKTVAHWSARVVGTGVRTAGEDEIDDVAWVDPDEARRRTGRDTAALDRLLELDAAGRLDAPRLLVVRHAKAHPRDRWRGEEADRPLTRTGRRQAQALADLLGCWRPEGLITSPWQRCVQTVRPYARATGLPLEQSADLTEAAHGADPGQVEDDVHDLLRTGADVAVCTHRPVLASVMKALAGAATDAGSDEVVRRLPDGDPWLATAEILVVHHALGRPFWVERHRDAAR
jgi:phosphohistidine phosphatase SixA/8-oxo-dGTP pyrophosphatase MutT (NUDIX family)